MRMNWKKIGILTADIVLGVYLVLAITAFNCPDDKDAVCREVNINITDNAGNGFLNANEVKMQLQHAKLYPLGDRMSDICTRKIEETLRKSPLVDRVECYKTQTGRVNINLTQRIAVMRARDAQAIARPTHADSGVGRLMDTATVCASSARPRPTTAP